MRSRCSKDQVEIILGLFSFGFVTFVAAGKPELLAWSDMEGMYSNVLTLVISNSSLPL